MAKEREADVRRSLDRLGSLRIDPVARSRFAAEAIASTVRADLIYACGQSLLDHPVPEGREPLIAAYERLDANPTKSDSGGAMRALILRALRPVAGSEDIPLFERSSRIYEVTVQGPAATELRAAAIVALTDLAPDLAAVHAARILAEADDPRKTAANTGEPAATAARVLGATGETAALYLAATMAWRPPDEALAECLRQLTALPETAVIELIERYRARESDLLQLGLIDLVAEHEQLPGEHLEPYVAWLRDLDGDVYRYALSTFVASRRTGLHELTAAAVEDEFDRDRLAIALEALSMSRGAAPLETARRIVQDRLGATRVPGDEAMDEPAADR